MPFGRPVKDNKTITSLKDSQGTYEVSAQNSLIKSECWKRVVWKGGTVRAEIIAELILKRAGPVIFKTFVLELIAFRPIPVICPARGVKPENYWKR